MCDSLTLTCTYHPPERAAAQAPCPCAWRPLTLSADGATTHLVPVVLKYGKRCNFGEHFAVVGSVPELGSWDPTKAVTMKVRQPACASCEHHRVQGQCMTTA